MSNRYVRCPTLQKFTFSRETEGEYIYKINTNNYYKKVEGKILARSEGKNMFLGVENQEGIGGIGNHSSLNIIIRNSQALDS